MYKPLFSAYWILNLLTTAMLICSMLFNANVSYGHIEWDMFCVSLGVLMLLTLFFSKNFRVDESFKNKYSLLRKPTLCMTLVLAISEAMAVAAANYSEEYLRPAMVLLILWIVAMTALIISRKLIHRNS